jgi:hypothetical protein
VAGVIAGILGLIAAYLAFCTWLYRRQLRVYKDHVAAAQRAALGYNDGPDDQRLSEKGAGAGGAPVVGAFGTVIGGGSRQSHSSSDPRASTSAGRPSIPDNIPWAGMRPPITKDISDATKITGRTDEGYMTGETPEYVGEPSTAYRTYTATTGPDGRSYAGSDNSSTEDLLGGMEPSFFSVVLSPRKTLRVINRD